MAVAQGSHPFTIGESISFGWDRFKSNIAPLAVVAIVVWGVEILMNVLIQPDSSFGAFLAQVLSFIVGSIIGMGWISISLEIVDGRSVELADVWKHIDKLVPYILASIAFGIMFAIGLILLIVPGIIAAVVFGYYGFCILDKDLPAVEGLKRSAEITRGHRGQLFLFGLALIGLNILGLLLLVVGVLVTSAISLIAMGYVYRTLDKAAGGTAPAQVISSDPAGPVI